MNLNQKLPYYYSQNWLEYLKEYNAFYQSNIIEAKIYQNNDFLWLYTLYYSKTRNQLELRTGDPYIMSPYWKHQDKIIKKKDIEKWFQKFQEICLELPFENKSDFMIHQFPLDTYRQRIPIFEYLKEKNQNGLELIETITRYRAWVELDKYTLPEIKSQIRKSYKSILNKFIKNYNHQVTIYDSQSITNCDSKDLAQRFRDAHYRQANKETKTPIGWQLLIKMVESGEAILIECQGNFLYFLAHPDYSYYGISASDKDNGFQIGLVYKAIEYLKEHKYKLLDMGMTYLNTSEKENDSKAYDIGFFKSGFATRITPDYYYKVAI